MQRALPLAVFAGALAIVVAAPAAALEQPNGTPIPSQPGCDSGQPTGLAAELACVCDQPGVCNIGEPCPGPGQCPPIPDATCETTLWHSFNDNTCIPSNLGGLDPWTDASLTPETFTPTCGLTFTVVTRGTAIFGDAFGWYNVTGARPDPSDLHVMLDCDDGPGTSVVLDVQNDPAYRGGEIGFFLLTPESHDESGRCAGDDCCARVDRLADGVGHVYYSERAFNPDAAGAQSFIHLLVYDSQVTERKFYFAWEDIFGGSNNDFTDLVTSVTGVECSGGGQPCDTGEPGACAEGVTVCRGDQLVCASLYDATEEVCDGVDNDCDGVADPPGTCTDDVSATCAGVECPPGETCRLGECRDPCKHVQCAAGEVCRAGVCFGGCTQCNGIVCGDGTVCDTDSAECVDPACLGGGCDDDADAGPAVGGSDGGVGPGATGETSGCGCTAGAAGAPLAAVLLALTALVAVRRRR